VQHERTPRESPLKRIREDRGLSQQQLADKANTSQPQIDRLEKHGLPGTDPKKTRKMTKQWAVRLAAVLECHWLELLDAPALSKDEESLVEAYRGMSEPDRNAVFHMIVRMASTQRHSIIDEPPAPKKRGLKRAS